MTKVTRFARLPYEADEEPGMPTFEISGTHKGFPFAGRLSIEIDGRDVDWEHTSGVNPGSVLDAALEHEPLAAAYKEAVNEYFGE